MQDGGSGTHPSRRQVVAVPTSTPGQASEVGFDASNQEGGLRRWPGHTSRGTDIRNPENRLSFLPSRAKHKNGPDLLRMCVASWSLKSPRPTP